jgi:EmrB/QacA subfamily drug resistance transporter
VNEHSPSAGLRPAVAAGRRPLILIAVMLAMFMAAVESTIVGTAMPSIIAQLGGFRLFSWVFAVFLLTQAVTIPLYGKLADIYGRKPMLLFGAVVFLVGSTLCGLAHDMVQLIAFRALQGLGAGAIQPIVFTVIGDIYTPAERARMQGWVSSVWGFSAIVGPTVGAFLVEQLSWRFVFWINLPIGLASMTMLIVFFREGVEHRRHKVDFAGAVLITLATTALMLALIQAKDLGGGALAGLLALVVAAFAAFIWQERRASEPMVPLHLFRIPVIALSNGGALIVGALLLGITSILPTYVQGVMGRSVMVTGFTLAALSLGWPIASTIGGRVMVHTSYRAVALAGGVLLLAGMLIMVALTPARGALFAGAGSFLVGCGMGCTTTTFMVATQAAVDWNQRGIATSSTVFTRLVGMSMGAALFGAVLNFGLHRRAGGITDAVNALMDPVRRAALPPRQVAMLTDAMAASMHEVFIIAVVLAAIATLLIAGLPKGLSPATIASNEGKAPADGG